jgi:hypothetical protein
MVAHEESFVSRDREEMGDRSHPVLEQTQRPGRPASRDKTCGLALTRIRESQRTPGPIVNPLASDASLRTVGRQTELQTLLCRSSVISKTDGSNDYGKVRRSCVCLLTAPSAGLLLLTMFHGFSVKRKQAVVHGDGCKLDTDD